MLCGDIMLQLERKGSISNITKPFIAIFVVNILLWIDFNVTMARRQKRQREPPTNRFVVQGPPWLPWSRNLADVQEIGGFP